MKLPLLMNNPSRVWIVLVAICFAIFTVSFNTTAVANALIAIGHELHLTPTALQWVVNAYLLACASFIIIGGQLGDMFGRRKMLLWGILCFIFSSLLIATSNTPTLMIIGRGLQGLSAAIITPGTLAVVKIAFPGNKERYAIGGWTATIGLGFAFGPIIGGLLTSYWSWRDIFWVNIPLMLIAFVLIFLFTRKSRGAKESAKLDLLGLILLISGLFPLTLGLIEGNIWGWSSFLTLFLLIGGIIVLIAFWIAEHLVNSPLVHFSHFQKRAFIAGNVGIAASIFSLMGVLFFFNIFIQNPILLHYSPVQASVALLPMSIALFIMSLITGSITKKFGYRLPMVIALLIAALGLWMLHNITIDSTYRDLWFPLLLFGFGVGISFPCSPALGMASLPLEKAGEGSGIINTINYYSGVLCIAIGTLVSIYSKQASFKAALASAHTVGKPIDQLGATTLAGHSLPPVTQLPQAVILQATQQATLHSFTTVMLMCAIVAILGAIGILFSVKKELNNPLK